MNTFVVKDQSGQIKAIYKLKGDEEGEGGRHLDSRAPLGLLSPLH